MQILRYPELIILIIAGFFTRFWHIGTPPAVVFDEAHFGLYASKYFSHQFYADIHPPLGKMLFAFFGWLGGGVTPGFDFAAGALYPDGINYIALRSFAALTGALLVPLVYIFVRELNFSRRAAFLAAFLVLFDNALIVESRFILLDIPLLFFILLSIYIFLLAEKRRIFSVKWRILSIACGLTLGAAISIKLVGLGALAFVWLILFWRKNIAIKKNALIWAAFLLILPLATYIVIFAFHIALLSNPCVKNCGAMLEPFPKSSPESHILMNEGVYGNILERIAGQNVWIASGTVGSSDKNFYYASPWYSWPFMVRPIPYHQVQIDETHISNIYLLGNPVVWLFGFLGILGTIYFLVKRFLFGYRIVLPKVFDSPPLFYLFAAYLIFFLPFASIAKDTMLYHYLPALLFSIVIFSVSADGILSSFTAKKANIILAGILFLALMGFLYFAPLTYGIPLANGKFLSRLWLPTWNY